MQRLHKGVHSMANGNDQIREDRIRERAYEIWEREGRKYGDHERHWEEAEKELRKKESGVDPSANPSEPGDIIGNTNRSTSECVSLSGDSAVAKQNSSDSSAA
ncbi:DUF2934 domain-containing protein [Sinorhizobium medicae]|nr:DUF2934 domain-containing protein [Sinorhizobium medicae]